MDVHAEVRISGTVQGVGYRAWTSRNAQGLGLRGWVRNEPDGTVAALFVGPRAVVESMVARCADGPEHAAVTEVQPTYRDPGTDESFVDFRIEP